MTDWPAWRVACVIARLCLLCVLVLTLTSCASLGKERIVFVPPPVDCAAFEAPTVSAPTEPAPGEKDPAHWQLFAYGWQAVAEHLLGQRLETARCLHQLKQQGVIK
jgi:hypothetical protein